MAQPFHRIFVPATLTLVLGGCGAFGSDTAGPGKVQDLVGWMERVHVESEVAAQRAAAAVQALRVLTSQDYQTDAVTAYAAFVEAVDASRAQEQALIDVVRPMKASSAPVFEKWEADLALMTSETMRARSQARLDATRGEYESIVKLLDPLMAAYEGFNTGLRDHALFLSHDLNPASLAAIAEDVAGLDRTAHELGFGFGSTLEATRTYIHGAALPEGTRAVRAGEAPAAGATPRATQPAAPAGGGQR